MSLEHIIGLVHEVVQEEYTFLTSERGAKHLVGFSLAILSIVLPFVVILSSAIIYEYCYARRHTKIETASKNHPLSSNDSEVTQYLIRTNSKIINTTR
jgi:cytoskeletal protein RodZ